MPQLIRKENFTKRYIESLKPEGKGYVVWDGIINGFGCKVSSLGRKTYIYMYRNAKKQQVKLTVGKHGPLTVEMARNKLKGIIEKLNSGIDVREEKKEGENKSKESILLKDFWTIFDEKYIKLHHKEASIQRNRPRLSNYIMPFFGEKTLKEIEYKDVVAFMDLPALRKAPIQAARCLALISPAFKHAELWGYRPKGSNPCIGVPKQATGKKERFLNDKEKKRLEEVLEDSSLHKGRSPYAIASIRLLLYTGCRKSEVTELKWEDVHIKDRYIYFKDSKTGTKTVPLNQQAINLLNSLNKIDDNPYVFPGKIPGTCIQEIRKAWESVRKLAKIPDVRLHDLRHSFASFALKKGVDLYTVSKLLGHKNITTTTRYAHLELDALKEATNKIFS